MAKISSLVIAAMIPFVVLAFWPMYLARPFATVDRYTHLHAVMGILWLLLLIVQPAAIHFRRFALHRALGRVSYVVAALFAIAGVLLSHHRVATMTDERFAIDGFNHYLPFYATTAFVIAYALGLWFRRTPAAHGRFMLFTGIPLIDPVLGRVMGFYLPPFPAAWMYQAITFAIGTAVAALLVLTYRRRDAARHALVGYLALLLILEAGWFALAPTAVWLDAVRWFRGLTIT